MLIAIFHRKAVVVVWISVGVNNTLQMRKTNLSLVSPKLDVLPVWGEQPDSRVGKVYSLEAQAVTGLTEEWGGGALQAWPGISCPWALFFPPLDSSGEYSLTCSDNPFNWLVFKSVGYFKNISVKSGHSYLSFLTPSEKFFPKMIECFGEAWYLLLVLC